MATFISRKLKQRGKRVTITARRPLAVFDTFHDFLGKETKVTKKETIFIHGMNSLKVDEKGRLYWNDRPVVTDVKISRWVNISIIIGAISTALYAIVTLLAYLKNCY